MAAALQGLPHAQGCSHHDGTSEPAARLTLRPVTPADRADLVALESDAQVMRYLNGGRPVPEAGLPDGDFLTPRGTEAEVLAAQETGTGRFIGWFAFFDDGLKDGTHRQDRLSPDPR